MNNDKPFGLGLIGCGDFGRFCMEAYSELRDVRPAGTTDLRREAATSFGKELGVPAFDDPNQLIAHRDVDIVHIATPPSSHYQLAMAAIRAGKHVLCEKPLAMTVAQGDELIAAAKEAGVIAPVNFVLRYNQVAEAAKLIIDSGVLGRVVGGRFTNCAFDTKLPSGHWFWDKSISGGIFIEHGVHFFDLYTHWLGPGQVINAHAEMREGTEQEDRVTCTVRHDSGAVVTHYHGFDQIEPMDRADHHLICEMGDIRVEGWIPLVLTVNAAVDDAGANELVKCLPDAGLETIQAYEGAQTQISGRGKVRNVNRRIRMRHVPQSDKLSVYSESARALLKDQITYIRDRTRTRRITEANGRDALILAETATKLAQKSSKRA